MKLAAHFIGAGAKYLKPVEVDPTASNEHEFNGIKEFKKLLGTSKKIIKTNFFYIGETTENCIFSQGKLTWYDAREKHPSRSEFRLYYTSNEVIDNASAGDFIVVALKSDGEAMVFITQANSTQENQLRHLFCLVGEQAESFSVQEITSKIEIDFVRKMIMDNLGIEIEEKEECLRDEIQKTFVDKFPSTKAFSEYARKVCSIGTHDASSDLVLCSWMESEEKLFRSLEKHIVSKRLKIGFDNVDEFMSFSLSVQNRRKSRVGHAFENHLAAIFDDNNIPYTKGCMTQNKSKPDFIFPGIDQYRDISFPTANLTMLGAKTTCKDRWRQILTEADRIEKKHLATLEPGISEFQTDDMIAHKLQLVIPKPIHASYKINQVKQLMTIDEFLELVKERIS